MLALHPGGAESIGWGMEQCRVRKSVMQQPGNHSMLLQNDAYTGSAAPVLGLLLVIALSPQSHAFSGLWRVSALDSVSAGLQTTC